MGEFNQFDEQIANTKYQTEELELEFAGQRMRELSELTSSSTELSGQLREARHAEEAERILNQKLNRELHQQKDNVAQLRNELGDSNEKLRASSESQSGETDALSTKLRELTNKLEQQQQIVNDARTDRDRQAEMRVEAEARLGANTSREKRLVDKVHYLEERVLNRSSDESDEADERTALQTARHGLEVTRQALSALSARLQVASVRSDTGEIEQCRGELAQQHKDLALIARTLNSARSSKRAQETGLLEHRINEQLRKLELSTERIQTSSDETDRHQSSVDLAARNNQD